ncbi:hypothetical protein C8Q79DRAFT_1009791 [Trametes meyenii]|nr:hypothetical protein C8Q79DRAFT_1009791 [Trametes meyenii]
MHTYNTRARKQQVFFELGVNDHSSDDFAVEIRPSETGEGVHILWHDLVNDDDSQDRDYSPPLPSNSSDSSSSSGSSSSSSSSSATGLIDDDGDSQMSDELEDRLQTPQREEPYSPGSVIMTPRKNRIQRHDSRMGGGFDFWHAQDGVQQRIAFSSDYLPIAPPAAGQQQQPLDTDTAHVRHVLEAHRNGLVRHFERNETIIEDDEVSEASGATWIVDHRASPEPTPTGHMMPIVRHPTLPADYDLSAPGSSRLGSRLPPIQEGSEAIPRWSANVREWKGMHLYHDANGRWVREGSLGPDAGYTIDKANLPPRVDVAGDLASQARQARQTNLRRTDTEPVPEAPTPRRRR